LLRLLLPLNNKIHPTSPSKGSVATTNVDLRSRGFIGSFNR